MMAKYSLRVVHKQFYDVVVEAESPEQARELFATKGTFYPDDPEWDQLEVISVEGPDD